MSTQRKKKDCNPEEQMQQLMRDITEAYLHPSGCAVDQNGHTQLKVLAEKFSMTPIKVRKLLVTSGVYDTPVCRRVQELYYSGMDVKEIQKETGLSAASVSGYLPYQKTIYKLEERSLLAERLLRYRKRKAAVQKLEGLMRSADIESILAAAWETLCLFEGYRFCMADGSRYHYVVRENKIIFSVGDGKVTVTKKRISRVLKQIMKIQEAGSGMGMGGVEETEGPEIQYLDPVWKRIGIIAGEEVRALE